MGRFTVSYEKWPHDPHYEFVCTLLGTDDFGTWGRCERGDDVLKGGVRSFVWSTPMMVLIPTGSRWWSVMWHPPKEAKFELYVDINTPAVWRGSDVVMCDLDLDIERTRDGTVSLLDEDEFATNAVARAYPDEIVAAAHAAARDVLHLVSTGGEPFGERWRSWYAECFASPRTGL